MKYLLCIAALIVVTYSFPFDGKIVGGQLADLGEFPWIVSLKYRGSHTCGASIISEKYALTAAHCVYGRDNPSQFSIQHGVVDISSGENIIDVDLIEYHEDYTPGGSYPNDVAILRLASPVPFDRNTQPVKLPEQGQAPAKNVSSILAGWGLDQSGGSVQRYLLKVDEVIYDDQTCSNLEYYYDPDVNLCSGNIAGGHGQCNGDSGGPLTVNGVQMGVVSWSVKPCASRNHPGIFARVSSYRDWIKDHTGV